MSRSRILPSLSSSRQMMMAWKVSGLSQSPAIIVSRPASMRLAMAISPSRDRSSTEPISRRYMRTGSSVRSVGSFLAVAATTAVPSARPVRRRLPRRRPVCFLGLVGFFVLDDVDAHVGQHRHRVLDLLGGHFLRRQDRVQLVHGDIAALLGGLDHLLDGVIGKVEQRAVLGFRRAFLVFGFFLGRCRHLLTWCFCHGQLCSSGHFGTGQGCFGFGRIRAGPSFSPAIANRTASSACSQCADSQRLPNHPPCNASFR